MATTTDYINQLKADKTNLVNNLIEKGASATQDETFTSLVPKVLNIETGITPTGTINITENGTYDVTDKASANVNVDADVSEYFFDSVNYVPDDVRNIFQYMIKKTPPFKNTYTTAKYMFKNAKVLTTISQIQDFNKVNATSYMFQYCSALQSIPLLDTSNVIDMHYMFHYCTSLTTIPLLDTSNVTDMSYMFSECSSLTTIPLLDTSKVIDMHYMFSGCSSLTTIPLLDTSNVTDMMAMFSGCSSLTAIPLLDTSKLTKTYSMFYRCSSLTIIPQLDTSKVNTAERMFLYCSSLETVPLLNMSSNLSIYLMFDSCTALTNLGGFQNLGQAFDTAQPANKSSYKLDLSASSKLTHDSLMNVGNNLYDIASKGCQIQQVVIGSTNIGKLTPEELLVFTNKGWSVS